MCAWFDCGGWRVGGLNRWGGRRVDEWRGAWGGRRGRVLDAPLLWLRLASDYVWC